jgi:hypothetical protein
LLIERPASIEEGFSQNSPLVYHYGHKTPGMSIGQMFLFYVKVPTFFFSASRSNHQKFFLSVKREILLTKIKIKTDISLGLEPRFRNFGLFFPSVLGTYTMWGGDDSRAE